MPIDKQDSAQADSLLSAPPSDPTSVGTRIPRAKGTYGNLSSTFTPPAEAHRQQYASLYFVRLMKMRSRLVESAKRKWGNGMCKISVYMCQFVCKCVLVRVDISNVSVDMYLFVCV